MTRLLSALLLIGAVAAAAIVANIALLSYASASNDPVGKLNPRAHLPAAPVKVLPPQTGSVDAEGGDD